MLKDLFASCWIRSDMVDVRINGREAGIEYILKDSDVIEYILKDSDIETKAKKEAVENPLEYAGTAFVPTGTGGVCVMVNGLEMELKGDKDQYIFVDVFNYVDFDLTRPKGSIVLKLNGRQAAFTDVIRPGDKIDIYWEK